MRSRKSIIFIITIFVFVLLGILVYKLIFTSDSMPTESLPSSQSDAPVTQDNEKRIPLQFPKDLPIYPGATIVSSWSSEAKGSIGMSVVLESPDELSKVSSYYSQVLPEAGWEMEISDSSETYIASIKKTVSDESLKALWCIDRSLSCHYTGFIGLTPKSETTAISITIGLQ